MPLIAIQAPLASHSTLKGFLLKKKKSRYPCHQRQVAHFLSVRFTFCILFSLKFREALRHAVQFVSLLFIRNCATQSYGETQEENEARSLRLYSPDALPQACNEYTLERTRLSGAPPARHVVRCWGILLGFPLETSGSISGERRVCSYATDQIVKLVLWSVLALQLGDARRGRAEIGNKT